MAAKKTGSSYSDKNYPKKSPSSKGNDSNKRDYTEEGAGKDTQSQKNSVYNKSSEKDFYEPYDYDHQKNRDKGYYEKEEAYSREKDATEDFEDSKEKSSGTSYQSSKYRNQKYPYSDNWEKDTPFDGNQKVDPQIEGNETRMDGSKQPDGQDNTKFDMVFTEEEVYGNVFDPPARDEIYEKDEPDTDRSNDEPIVFGSLSETQINRVKARFRIPENGFLVETRRGSVRKNLEVERIRQLSELFQDEEVRNHIRDTLILFTNDTDERSRQDRSQIDLALVLAVAIRESGVRTSLSRSNRRIVSAGRDAHTEGRSGLDWLYDYKRFFPVSIRSEIHPVVGNDQAPGSFRREVHPAYIRERDLLAAFIVEIRQRYRRFLRRFQHHEFRDFSEAQQQSLLNQMSNDSRRAWTQAAFGSKLTHLLIEVRDGLLRPMLSGTPWEDLLNDDQLNLNAIITNDDLMPDNLSRQRCRISAAEAMLVEELINQQF
ncbi:hypothetical protein [Gramella sp. KN1008]|uniref:hypothetical protein n=1 Tax=Gramella sp. KN1008 TaxID=2529298 RepID=UPI00103B2EEC|nr:hypothetical protein [Gramella sp. KN1008]TBW28680.1 hypothetical protein EZJ28_08075 [Gramella sp. KN1008]